MAVALATLPLKSVLVDAGETLFVTGTGVTALPADFTAALACLPADLATGWLASLLTGFADDLIGDAALGATGFAAASLPAWTWAFATWTTTFFETGFFGATFFVETGLTSAFLTTGLAAAFLAITFLTATFFTTDLLAAPGFFNCGLAA